MGGYVNISKEVATEFLNGQGTVGTTKAALISAETLIDKYVIIKAHLTNANNVFVGTSTITATNGFMLDAGETTPPIHIDDLSKVYVIGDAAAQGYSWLAV